MQFTRFTPKPSCRHAAQTLKRIVSGEATDKERDTFAAHLAACRRCGRTLGRALDVAETLRDTLVRTAARFPTPPALSLPDRRRGEPRASSPLHVLVDFTLLLVLGLGIFLLLAFSVVAYRSLLQEHERVRVFRATQEILHLTRGAARLQETHPEYGLTQLRESLERESRQGTPGFPPPGLADPWEHVYILSLVEGALRVRSAGPNGVDEGGRGDDITAETPPPPLGTRRPAP